MDSTKARGATVSETMSRPEVVWEKTWCLLVVDVLEIERQKLNNPELELSGTQRYNICLTYIEDALLSNSKSLKNIVNMPFPDAQFTMENYNRLIYDELNYKIPDLINQHKALYGSLTLEQKAALRSKGEIVLNVASSGIAALLLDGGRIAHSRFAIPINIVEDSLCTITVDSDLADLIRQAKLTIWDEAPMVHRHCFDAFDRTLRDIATGTHNNSTDKVFGGKVIVFGGDFRQIL
ncbi:putative PIF1 DNA helicase/replication protein A1-like protein [Tanacetum coccineum]|uniref:ATP-dependent DNA helicase n=1 Tax=Tanacetum coccineum TaxID=301880 RepID=A0ABQ5ANC5_9ASTR